MLVLLSEYLTSYQNLMNSTDQADSEVQYEGTRVGLVTHFYDKIFVAVVHAEDTIKVGDSVKVYDKSGNVILEQTIDSMEIDGEGQESVDKGTDFGLKMEGEVKDGYVLYRQ